MDEMIEKTEKRAVILIVDDMEMNRNVLHDLILTLGYEPRTAEDGETALKCIEENPPDLVLLDIMMPGIDGYEVLDRIKGNEKSAPIAVIMITAIDELESAASCIQKGADDYLTKPFNPVLLKARLISSLDKKRSHDREKRMHAQLQASYEELRKIEQARDALANMIVHDLNNPLTIISATCSLTQSFHDSGALDDEALTESLANIGDASFEMIRLIKGILDVSKLENGQMVVNLVDVNVSEMATSIYERTRKQAEMSGLALEHECSEEDIIARADKDLVNRVIQNLVSNAIKHNIEGVCVRLCVSKQDDECVITVSDDGMGIRKSDMERVFDKYFQVAGRVDGRKYGVGMGLTFCKMAAEAQQGRIWVESVEGEGAAFHVALPLV